MIHVDTHHSRENVILIIPEKCGISPMTDGRGMAGIIQMDEFRRNTPNQRDYVPPNLKTKIFSKKTLVVRFFLVV